MPIFLKLFLDTLCRLEMEHFEREKREREIREMRDKEMNERLKEELMKSAAGSRIPGSIDPHWLEMQRRFVFVGNLVLRYSTSCNVQFHIYRFSALNPSAPGGALHPFGLYAAAGQPAALTPLERERLERLGNE